MVDTSLGFGSPSFQSPSRWKGWLSFAFGGIAILGLVYLGIARPAADELSQLREQIRSLEKSVALLVGQREAVDETNHLLSQLSQQQSQANAARKTLVDLRELTGNLLAESARFQEATIAIRQFASIKDLLLANADGLERAAEALAANEALQERLTSSAETNEAALRASLDLLAIRAELLQDNDRNNQARIALNGLMQIRSTLDRESFAIDIAQNRVEELVSLKDSVLAQTGNLSETIETLELTSELNERFRFATSTFKEIRDWMIELAAMEPTFAQIRRILEPVADLVNLNRLDPGQIRDFTRAFVEQSQVGQSENAENMVSLRSPAAETSEATESDEAESDEATID